VTVKRFFDELPATTACVDSDETMFSPSQMIERIRLAANDKNLLRRQAWLQGSSVWAGRKEIYICSIG